MMNNENREDGAIVEDERECTSQISKIVIFAIASASDRTAEKLLKLGLTTGR